MSRNFRYASIGLSSSNGLIFLGSNDGVDFAQLGKLPLFVGSPATDPSMMWNPTDQAFFIATDGSDGVDDPQLPVLGLQMTTDLTSVTKVTTNGSYVGQLDATWPEAFANAGVFPVPGTFYNAPTWGSMTLNATYLNGGGGHLNLAVLPLKQAIISGAIVQMANGDTVATSGAAAKGATVLPIILAVPSAGVGWVSGSTIYSIRATPVVGDIFAQQYLPVVLTTTYTLGGGPVTSIAVQATAAALSNGDLVRFANGDIATLNGAASAGATSLSIISLTPSSGAGWVSGTIAQVSNASFPYNFNMAAGCPSAAWYCVNTTNTLPPAMSASWVPLRYSFTNSWAYDGTDWWLPSGINARSVYGFLPIDQTGFTTWNTGNSGSNPVSIIPDGLFANPPYGCELFQDSSGLWHAWVQTFDGTHWKTPHATYTSGHNPFAGGGSWTIVNTDPFGGLWEGAQVVQIDNAPTYRIYHLSHDGAHNAGTFWYVQCTGNTDLLNDNWGSPVQCTVQGIPATGVPAQITSVLPVGMPTSPLYDATATSILNAAPLLTIPVPVGPMG